jgi:phosphopantothenoylcysteine synthetase/decarboxylase
MNVHGDLPASDSCPTGSIEIREGKHKVSEPVLYVIVCGCPAAIGVTDFVKKVQADGWNTSVIATPMGSRFINSEELSQLTGHPVRTTYKHPDEPDVLPPAAAIAVAPATFNTVNKIANGITDTLAAGITCEGIGLGIPVIVAPSINAALAQHGAFRRSLGYLADYGVHLILNSQFNIEPRSTVNQGSEFPWHIVRQLLASVQSA